MAHKKHCVKVHYHYAGPYYFPLFLPQPAFDLHGRFCGFFLPCPLTNFFASFGPLKIKEYGVKFVSPSSLRLPKPPAQ